MLQIELLKRQAMDFYNSLVILEGCYDDDLEDYTKNTEKQFKLLFDEYFRYFVDGKRK